MKMFKIPGHNRSSNPLPIMFLLLSAHKLLNSMANDDRLAVEIAISVPWSEPNVNDRLICRDVTLLMTVEMDPNELLEIGPDRCLLHKKELN